MVIKWISRCFISFWTCVVSSVRLFPPFLHKRNMNSPPLDVGSHGFHTDFYFPAATPATLISSSSSSSSSSCLDNITAYYFSYFHPSLCPYRPVSQAVMCDLELSLRLRVSSVGVRWLVYWDVTGGVTPNKPTSPSSPFLTPSLCDRETPPWCDGWVAGCSRQVGCG